MIVEGGKIISRDDQIAKNLSEYFIKYSNFKYAK